MKGVGFLTHTLKFVLLSIVLASIPALALAATRTHVHVYDPFNSAGQPRGHVAYRYTGSCSASRVSRRRDTWRCLIDAGFGSFELESLTAVRSRGGSTRAGFTPSASTAPASRPPGSEVARVYEALRRTAAVHSQL
jgi:hypothetical protein